MRKRTWILLTVSLIIGTLVLGGCSSKDMRNPDTTPTPNQTRTVPSPTRVTPPITPTPSQTRTVPTPTKVTPKTQTPGNTNMSGTTTRPNTINKSTTTGETGNRAKQIAKDIAQEKDIQSASCVVTGDTALVGLQFEKQYKGDVTDTIKKSVEKRIKNYEPTIKKVVVTADPDLLSRIKTMATDIGNGKPLSGFTTEIEEIIRRINPF